MIRSAPLILPTTCTSPGVFPFCCLILCLPYFSLYLSHLFPYILAPSLPLSTDCPCTGRGKRLVAQGGRSYLLRIPALQCKPTGSDCGLRANLLTRTCFTAAGQPVHMCVLSSCWLPNYQTCTGPAANPSLPRA